MPYENPVIPGFYPDPSVCRVGNDYYLVTSSFEYFPGVPVFHSRDLVHWRQIGHCLTRDSQLPLQSARSSGGIYAPTIRHHNGRFYMVTTNVSGGGNFCVFADDPTGEWSEPVFVDQGGIDPSMFFNDDGTVYFTSTGENGIYQSILDIETGKRLSEIRHLWTGTGGRYPEAPHLYTTNGHYYLLMAEGGTEYGHMETIARSSSPWGPWEPCPRNPILSHRNLGTHPIQATGHAEMFDAPDGSWWAVFLAVRPSEGYPPAHHIGRETFLAPVRWDEDGWPVFGSNGRADLTMDAPDLPSSHPWEPEPSRDDFESANLRVCWNFRRNPLPESWSLTDRPGWLRLTGAAAGLDDAAPLAFVGRRQQHFSCRAATRLEFDPAKDGEEAGLTVLMNERHHYEVCVTREAGQRHIAVRRRIGDLSAVVASRRITEEGPVTLEIQADPARYTFAFAVGDDAPSPGDVLATGETRYLSSEVAGGFTGVYLAMYATGNGQPASAPAYFDWFDYEGR